MPPFIIGHATHPDAHMALALAAAQLDAQRAAQADAAPATLGLMYLTSAYAPQADSLLAEAQQRWPGVLWAGCVGVGVLAGAVEYFDEPALVLMLAALPAGSFQIFNGRQSLADGLRTHTALVHADPNTPELDALVAELAERTTTGYLFGGLSSGMSGDPASNASQPAHWADGVFSGGLSGVAFGPEVHLVSRVTQGCQPVGPARRITAADRNLVLTLDNQPALGLLLADLNLSLDKPQQALAGLRSTLAGLTDGRDEVLSRGGQFGADTRVRHLIGIDPGRHGVAVAEQLQTGQQLSFCRRDMAAARRDLVRICAEIREELDIAAEAASPAGAEPDAEPPGVAASAQPDMPPAQQGQRAAARVAGAIYVSCSGRGGPHFGAPSAEAQILQHALGDVPLVGFFAAGEIARHHLYGYTGVLTVFVTS